MPLLCAVVARSGGENSVLARYSSTVGNFNEVIAVVLNRIAAEPANSKENKKTFMSDGVAYHYSVSPGIKATFVAISDAEFDRDLAFAFLTGVQNRFLRDFNAKDVAAAEPFGMQGAFNGVLEREMRRRNTEAAERAADADVNGGDGNPDRIERLRGEVEQVKGIMVQNIDAIMERGERMELLVDKAENLSNSSISFRQVSTQVRRKAWWQNVRMRIAVGLVSVGIVYLVVSASCGGLLWPNCV